MENVNSVCFVAKIDEIKLIEGADNIELAIVGGWSCIVKKGEQSVGSLIICATTDAIIPQALSDAMNVTNYLRKGGRVRTVKLRGVYSECLLIPLHYLSGKLTMGNPDIKEGMDVMEIMGITKYEPPAKTIQLASGKKIRYIDNPNFNIYYKFPNIKNVTGIFTEEDDVQITRKIHGTNARYGIVKKTKLSLKDRIKLMLAKKIKPDWKWAEYEFVVGSHNIEKGSDSQGYYDTNVWYEIAEKYNIKDRLWNLVKSTNNAKEVIGNGLVLYGEIYGAGIQKGYDYGLNDIQFVGFDLIMNGKYEPTYITETILSHIHIPHVEILYKGKWRQVIQDSFVFKNYIPGTNVPHEGIVIKHESGERNKVAKVINPDYSIYAEKKDIGDSH